VEYGERSLSLARELGPKEQLAFTLKDLAVVYVICGRFPDAHAILPEAISLWRELDNKPMLAEVLGGQAAQYLASGELDAAVRTGEESYALNQSIRNRFGLSITGSFSCFAYKELGQMEMAIRRGREAISIAEEVGLRSGLSWVCLVELASMYGSLGDFVRAVECAERAIATADPEIPGRVGYAKAVLAVLCLQRGQRAEAEALLESFTVESFESFLETTAVVTGQPIFSHAELALAQNDPGRALALMDDVIESAGQMGILILLLPALHVKAKALRALDRVAEAHTMLLDARDRAATMQARYRLLPILMTLRELELALGHPAEAEAVRLEAREVATYIAEHSPDELRTSFQNLPSVRVVIDPS
jgi:tetratricopeptide (TPR) repeat protein